VLKYELIIKNGDANMNYNVNEELYPPEDMIREEFVKEMYADEITYI